MPAPRYPTFGDVSEGEALKLQRELALRVETEDRLPTPLRRVAGVDVAYEIDGDRVFAAAVVFNAESLMVAETATAVATSRMPYVSGLFSFRELPAILAALEQLNSPPDLVICDGQGRAHPRRFGLACHLGVLCDLPTIGCGKTVLCGQYEAPGPHRGDHAPLFDQGEMIGSALRTQDNVRPVFVSTGHRISLPTARSWVLRMAPRYRLCETTRESNRVVNVMRQAT